MADYDHDVKDPAVRALIAAINAGDQQAFFAALTPDATMSDDGTDRTVAEWADREIFSVHGHLDVVSAHDGARPRLASPAGYPASGPASRGSLPPSERRRARVPACASAASGAGLRRG
jgi:hypothetical protein